MDLSNKTIEKLLHEQLLKLPLNNTTTIFNGSFSKKVSGRWFKWIFIQKEQYKDY